MSLARALTQRLLTTSYVHLSLADSGINDRLAKLRSLIDQTCFEFIDVRYFGAVNFLPQNTPDAVFC